MAVLSEQSAIVVAGLGLVRTGFLNSGLLLLVSDRMRWQVRGVSDLEKTEGVVLQYYYCARKVSDSNMKLLRCVELGDRFASLREHSTTLPSRHPGTHSQQP